MSSRMSPPCAQQFPPEQFHSHNKKAFSIGSYRKHHTREKDERFKPGVIRLLLRRCHPLEEVV